jgi:hypothetical protein
VRCYKPHEEATKCCVACKIYGKESSKKWARDNPEKKKDYNRKYRETHKVEMASLQKRWAHDNPEKRRATMKRWRKRHPDLNQERLKKYRLANKDKIKQQQKFYRETHIEERTALLKNWYENNLHRYRIYVHNRNARLKGNGGTHTTEEIDELFDGQRGLCFYCGQLLRDFHIDHKIPVSRGGSNDISNIVISCALCNRRKYTKTAEEFIALINDQ